MSEHPDFETLSAYVDQHLPHVELVGLAQHLSDCASCRAQIEQLEHLRQRIGQAEMRHLSDHAFSARLRHALDETLNLSPPAPSRNMGKFKLPFSRWWQGFGVGALASVCVAIVTLEMMPRHHDIELSDELVSSHFRSLQVDHLSDVVSSDRHTVKPWFTGKVDFAPPVHDFAADQYALIGGRLDYVQHRSVAVLVYRYHQHIINVYVWPDNSQATSAATQVSRQGYHLLGWQTGGMHYWAVSDTGEAELQRLQALMEQAV